MSNLSILKRIKKNQQYEEIDGMIVDGLTARVVLSTDNALKGERKKKYRRIIEKDLLKAVDIAWMAHRD